VAVVVVVSVVFVVVVVVDVCADELMALRLADVSVVAAVFRFDELAVGGAGVVVPVVLVPGMFMPCMLELVLLVFVVADGAYAALVVSTVVGGLAVALVVDGNVFGVAELVSVPVAVAEEVSAAGDGVP
jgi:hypothetical protein